MSEPTDRAINRLSSEPSPYLRQHASNPVAWWPWSEEALAHARDSGKPILLSIGYSACHWCHVMAHESFDDSATAAVMNEHFVNIKVDREERPDLDKIYQLAHQLLVQRPGGWPLTMFLTPDNQIPFFGGTYFPPEPRHGMPAFKELCLRVVDFLAEHPDEVSRQNQALRDALHRTNEASCETTSPAVSDNALAKANAAIERLFDSQHGGFGSAPKFPHPTNLERLLRTVVNAPGNAADAKRMLEHTLTCMADGGLYDHVGGGFYRYSVDDEWMIPHFEKMLYDNGPLLGLYAAAYALDRNPGFRAVAQGIAEWTVREMQSPDGGYFAALDADSEGEEGKFYLWHTHDVASEVSPDELAVLLPRFGLDLSPNFEGRAWHLFRAQSLDDIVGRTGLSAQAAQARLTSGLSALFDARERRVRPDRDDKILVSWNALMITGMARGARFLRDASMLRSAERARDFLFEHLWANGRLLATWVQGRARLNAYLDDYALLLEAVLELLALRWRRADLDWAIELADVLLDQFEDPVGGGFYFTANEHETLLHRPMPFIDDALPAGNGTACVALLRLGHLIGDVRYLEAARRGIVRAWPGVQRAPHAHNAVLHALEDYLSPPALIVLRANGRQAEPWESALLPDPASRRYCVTIPNNEPNLPGLLAERTPRGPVTAYVCTGLRCDAPTTNLETFRAQASSA